MLRNAQRSDSPLETGCLVTGRGARSCAPTGMRTIDSLKVGQNGPHPSAFSAPGTRGRVAARHRPDGPRHHLRAVSVIEMTLPWPPSVNSYWRHPTRGALAGRHLISEEGRRYRKVVFDTVFVNRLSLNLTGRLKVEIKAYPPDRRRRDLDNILKALLDAITHARVIEDDSCIDDLRIVRQPPRANGEIQLTILESET